MITNAWCNDPDSSVDAQSEPCQSHSKDEPTPGHKNTITKDKEIPQQRSFDLPQTEDDSGNPMIHLHIFENDEPEMETKNLPQRSLHLKQLVKVFDSDEVKNSPEKRNLHSPSRSEIANRSTHVKDFVKIFEQCGLDDNNSALIDVPGRSNSRNEKCSPTSKNIQHNGKQSFEQDNQQFNSCNNKNRQGRESEKRFPSSKVKISQRPKSKSNFDNQNGKLLNISGKNQHNNKSSPGAQKKRHSCKLQKELKHNGFDTNSDKIQKISNNKSQQAINKVATSFFYLEKRNTTTSSPKSKSGHCQPLQSPTPSPRSTRASRIRAESVRNSLTTRGPSFSKLSSHSATISSRYTPTHRVGSKQHSAAATPSSNNYSRQEPTCSDTSSSTSKQSPKNENLKHQPTRRKSLQKKLDSKQDITEVSTALSILQESRQQNFNYKCSVKTDPGKKHSHQPSKKQQRGLESPSNKTTHKIPHTTNSATNRRKCHSLHVDQTRRLTDIFPGKKETKMNKASHVKQHQNKSINATDVISETSSKHDKSDVIYIQSLHDKRANDQDELCPRKAKEKFKQSRKSLLHSSERSDEQGNKDDNHNIDEKVDSSQSEQSQPCLQGRVKSQSINYSSIKQSRASISSKTPACHDKPVVEKLGIDDYQFLSNWFSQIPFKLQQKLLWKQYDHLNSFSVSDLKGFVPTNFRKAFTVNTSIAKSTKLALRESIAHLQCKEVPFRSKHTCSMYWCCGSFKETKNTNVVNTWVSCVPGLYRSARKVFLARVLQRAHRLFPDSFDFCPSTWQYPSEYEQFCIDHDERIAAQRAGKTDATKQWVYIVKPDDGAHGTGIFLTKNPRDKRFVGLTRNHVIQDYIANPLLMDGFKFDLRIYALVTSVNPLELYLHQEGMARFCTMPYEPPSNENMEKTFMHLTNYTLNKNSNDFVRDDPNALTAENKRHIPKDRNGSDIIKNRGNSSDFHGDIGSKEIGKQLSLANGYTNQLNRKNSDNDENGIVNHKNTELKCEHVCNFTTEEVANECHDDITIMHESSSGQRTVKQNIHTSETDDEEEYSEWNVLELLTDSSPLNGKVLSRSAEAVSFAKPLPLTDEVDGEIFKDCHNCDWNNNNYRDKDGFLSHFDNNIGNYSNDNDSSRKCSNSGASEYYCLHMSKEIINSSTEKSEQVKYDSVTVLDCAHEKFPPQETFETLFDNQADYDDSDGALRDDAVGSKRTLSSIMAKLEMEGHDVQLLWSRISTIVSKTMMALAPGLWFEGQKVLPKQGSVRPKCFQVIGLDVLIDEINANPSLRIDAEVKSPFVNGQQQVISYEYSHVDASIKVPIVRDGMALLIQKLYRMHIENPGIVEEPVSKGQKDHDQHMLRQQRLQEIREREKEEELAARCRANERRKQLLAEKRKKFHSLQKRRLSGGQHTASKYNKQVTTLSSTAQQTTDKQVKLSRELEWQRIARNEKSFNEIMHTPPSTRLHAKQKVSPTSSSFTETTNSSSNCHFSEKSFGFIPLHDLISAAGRDEQFIFDGLRDLFSHFSGR